MNFDFDDDQQAIKQTAREFLSARYPLEEVRRLAEDTRGFTDAQWSELAGLGWPALMVPEADGGLGLGAVELTIVCEELGYALAPSPLQSTVSAGLLLVAAGTSDQRERWLGPLAAGDRRGTLALVDADGQPDPRDGATGTGDRGTLRARKIAVPDAASADCAIVAGGEGRHWLVELDQAGARVELTASLDSTRKLATLELDDARAEPLDGDVGAITRAYDVMATALAAESVGVAQRALEMAVAYASERQQFGRPIGAYQAVSHRCAQMLLEVEGARSLTYFAAWALDHEPASAGLAASMAKAYASDAAFRVPAAALQVHGGIGFTWEHDLHFFLKRGTANAHALGDARWHRARVAELAGV